LLDHPKLVSLGREKRPPHLHPYQEEYITVVEGKLAVESNSIEYILTPADSEFVIKSWTNNRLYPPLARRDGEKVTWFLLSGIDTAEMYKLD
jgi:hypothetical protein